MNPCCSIYLDSNATTPLDPDVLLAITSALESAWGNPSSRYDAGVKAKRVISAARNFVATMVATKPDNIIFTSGGTEGNNMVLHSAVQHFWLYHPLADGRTQIRGTNSPRQEVEEKKYDPEDGLRPHFVTSNIEHDSISKVLQTFEANGLADVTYVPVSKRSGRVEATDILSAVRPNTVMVTVMLANNETGVIQPVGEIASKLCALARSSASAKILLHTDASQAIGKIPVDVQELGVNFLTITGHKFYGPRIGALYASDPSKIIPLFHGGGQERGYRPGTENTGMIAGLGKAAELVIMNVQRYEDHMKEMRDYLEDSLQKKFGLRVQFNGRYPTSERLPNTCNVSFLGQGLQGNKILARCRHMQASVGAACHSDMKYSSSPILLASGVPPEVASNAVRLSMGRTTSKEDIDLVVNDLKLVVNMLLSENGWQ
ncbi:Selenocysteine lyase [Lamellibrachia satsuma]|nr:Selenocysteine lyase [Lamellibrachia satsuma]